MISSLDIYYIVKELQQLISAKVDKIFQPEKEEFYFQFHLPNVGKKILRITPDSLYITEYKKPTVTPPNFCIFLRRRLSGSRLREIKQLENERIVKFLFETKEEKYILIVELFSTGNLILCKEDYTIISALHNQKWSERTIAPKIKYEYPKTSYNYHIIKESELYELLNQPKKVVVQLATELGFGGIYAEEICNLAKIDKDKEKLNKTETKKILKAIKLILNQDIDACQYDKKFSAFPLTTKNNPKHYNSFSELLDEMLTEKVISETPKRTKKDKINDIIRLQENRIKGLKKAIKDNQEKGECIYNNYTLIKEILDEINKAKKKLSFKEIKEKLKGHKVIKSLDEENKTITIEHA